ncbi:MAG: aldehyde dehydrogenase family protein [Thermodesulfobacteriota bacterium]|nr:aldehyde dehydrogenase family protein [Thermodesulfobacteriota bacterium]
MCEFLFTGRPKAESCFLKKVKAGGVCINETMMHLSNRHLPFGGTGASGMGKYHGKEIFTVFSNQKSVLKKMFFDNPLRYPPLT